MKALLLGVVSQAPFKLPPEATFEDYLAAHWPEDDVTEAYLDPLSLKGAPKPMHKAPAAHEVRRALACSYIFAHKPMHNALRNARGARALACSYILVPRSHPSAGGIMRKSCA